MDKMQNGLGAAKNWVWGAEDAFTRGTGIGNNKEYMRVCSRRLQGLT